MATLSDREIKEWIAREVDLGSIRVDSKDLGIASSNRNPSSNTWVVSCSNPNGFKPIFIKHHREEIMYEREKRLLGSLRRYSTGAERYAVPEILAWNDRLKLVALRWLKGEPVGRLLRTAVGRTRRAQDFEKGLSLAYEVGRWLYHFERRTFNGKRESFPSEAVMDRIRELTILIRDIGLRGFNNSFSQAIEKYVECSLSFVKEHYEFSAIHRDFWFGHIWKSTTGIVVIDYGRCINGPRGRDAVQFYLSLSHLSTLNPLVSNHKVRLLQAEFLRGYGKLDFSAPHIKVYMMIVQLEQLGGIVDKTYEGILAKGVGRLYARACFSLLSQSVGSRMAAV